MVGRSHAYTAQSRTAPVLIINARAFGQKKELVGLGTLSRDDGWFAEMKRLRGRENGFSLDRLQAFEETRPAVE